MNIVLVSQCRKKALGATRRILDQFAERCGERTWQTPITEAGLETLYRLLRANARKNTAVACHWTHGKNHTELLWIVGDRRQFNRDGRVPTNRTRRDILREGDENPWIHGHTIQLVVTLAALFHDLGKATHGFQNKLRNGWRSGDPYRHEWLSLRLFQRMVAGCENDDTWLARLTEWERYRAAQPAWHAEIVVDGERPDDGNCDFSALPPLARWIAWLLVSHHRLPLLDGIDYNAPKERAKLREDPERALEPADKWYARLVPVDEWQRNPNAEPSRDFKQLAADPTAAPRWQKMLTRWAHKARHHPPLMVLAAEGNTITDPLLLHLSRLCLMTGDHNHSAQRRAGAGDTDPWPETLIANTLSSGVYNQTLEEHLCGVARETAGFSRVLFKLPTELPGLGRHRKFRARTSDKRFQWQNRAYDLAAHIREQTEKHGFFGVTLASTGAGKTLGNAKILYALADPERGARFTIALGLRTLTLQTGAALRDKLGLRTADLVTLIGSQAIANLFDTKTTETDPQREETLANVSGASVSGTLETIGSDSAQALFDPRQILDIRESIAGGIGKDTLGTIVADPKVRQLLFTPLVSCTIDHLMPLCEQRRGGRYIVPMLRLLSGDLVLDEADDFALDDLPALSRLVYWAGLLGSRVLLSSATLPLALVRGLYQAYRDGRALWNRQRGLPEPEIVCAWFDEFSQRQCACGNAQAYETAHRAFCARRIEKLKQLPARRIGAWLPVTRYDPDVLAATVLERARELHAHHGETCPESGEKISFGLIRFANIAPLIAVARAMLHQSVPQDTRVHLVCYHARQLLILRSLLEEKLDRLLNRSEPKKLFAQPEIRHALATHPAENHLFIVLGSPVTEVGRDHDYDWAIVEPSSLRSLIQLAGRVLRHRPEKIAETANILVLGQNIRALKRQEPAYCRPGYETKTCQLREPAETGLFSPEQLHPITSAARLLPGDDCNMDPPAHRGVQYYDSLAELEHAMLTRLFDPLRDNLINAYRRPDTIAPMSAHLARISPFRAGRAQEDFVVLPDSDDQDALCFKTAENAWRAPDDNARSDNARFAYRAELEHNERVRPWLACPYHEALATLAARMDKEDDIRGLALRYATVSLDRTNDIERYRFHHWLGFFKDR